MTGAGVPSLAATERRLRDSFTAAAQTVAPGSISGLPRPADRPGDARGRPVHAPRLASRYWFRWPRPRR